MITKKELKTFVEKATALVNELGFIKKDKYGYEYSIMTVYGTYRIKIDSETSYLYSIFGICMDDDFKESKFKYEYNKSNGKMNFHSSHQEIVLQSLKDFVTINKI